MKQTKTFLSQPRTSWNIRTNAKHVLHFTTSKQESYPKETLAGQPYQTQYLSILPQRKAEEGFTAKPAHYLRISYGISVTFVHTTYCIHDTEASIDLTSLFFSTQNLTSCIKRDRLIFYSNETVPCIGGTKYFAALCEQTVDFHLNQNINSHSSEHTDPHFARWQLHV